MNIEITKEDLTRVKRFFHEFKTFAIKGNMLDMAIGVIVGGAFTAIVNSIVGHIAMPVIGMLVGIDLSSWVIELPRLYGNAEPGTLGVGNFVNTVITFFIIAFVVFCFVKAINKMRRKNEEAPPPPPPEPTKEELLLSEIRDILKEQSTGK